MELKQKARKLLFNSGLKQFPVVFELYLRAFGLDTIQIDSQMGEVIKIVRSSKDEDEAFVLVCHYLDELEEGSARIELAP